ncbi:class I SAM-dependent methyltransferase [Naumannella halotolerans]|uniref:class I SAM-dependent methyltransferase n=1 Tax=Naumannella halotolerans TaxID=993414 RepID=UPI00370D4368
MDMGVAADRVGPLRKAQVAGEFDRVADTYDTMVGLNPGYGRHLRLAADALLDEVEAARPLVSDPVLLDLGCGSGLSTRALLDAARERGIRPRIIGVDASAGMLAQARRRQWPAEVQFVHARAEELGERGFPAADGILACYLLRNVTDLQQTLQQLHAALRTGAPLVIEEYSVAESAAARRRWQAVNTMIIDPLARLVAGQAELYRYLHASVNEFIGIDELAQRLARAGFSDLAHRTVSGWQRDILHLLRARAAGPAGSAQR